MTLNKLAKAFGVTIGDLASVMGYTRQGLYDLVKCKNNTNKRRLYAALELLQDISDSHYKEDLAEARIQKNIREKGIEWLKTLAE
jgi:hypothetical protein